MLKTVIAVERDGLSYRAITIHFDVPYETFDLTSAVKMAATDFCKSDDGRDIYVGNCHCFNWADFESDVPNEFCLKHGFSKIDGKAADMIVDWDEHLVDDEELEELDDSEEEL